MPLKNITTQKYSVVDLFCGVGGLSHGFVLEGFNVIAGIDFDSSCEFAYEYNNKTDFLPWDLTITNSQEIDQLFPKKQLKILIGCAPCQAFSNLSNKYKNNDKWKLLYSFGRFIKEIKPDVVSMENVPQLKTYNNGKVFQDFCKILEDLEYNISINTVNAADYGVPQQRNRLILLASRLGEISLIPKTHTPNRYVTVWDAIGSLPPIKDGETDKKDSLHRSRKLSPLNKERIKATPEGGGWKDWDESLRLECHKKESGKTFRNVYGRMKRNSVAPTLTTQCTGYGNGRFGHPKQHRAISLREAAILQSFPKRYKFFKEKDQISVSNLEKHIGNAVPVLLGRVIAKSIKRHLDGINR